jgi:Lrp/AsnC family transcriptional regulator, leucine-responsive regulatory protein
LEKIDEIDAQILTLLQERGRMKRGAIADEVGLSVPSISERIRKLEDRDVITGYHAVVDRRKLGFDIGAFIRVVVDGSAHYEDFVSNALALPDVQEVHSVTGDGSHILRVITRDTSGLEHLLSQIQSWPGVHGTFTSLVLSSFKDSRTVRTAPRVEIEPNV